MSEIKARKKDNAARMDKSFVTVRLLRDCGFGKAGDVTKLSPVTAGHGVANGALKLCDERL